MELRIPGDHGARLYMELRIPGDHGARLYMAKITIFGPPNLILNFHFFLSSSPPFFFPLRGVGKWGLELIP